MSNQDKLDRDHPLPLYYQMMQDLRLRIEQGQWKAGDLIPSEHELCEIYGVSRMTARRALEKLAEEGLLRRDQGRGTFVTKPKIRKRISRLSSFSEDMRAQGKRASARVLRLQLVPAPPHVAAALQIDASRPVVLAERLRLANEQPVGVERGHLFFDGCEAILQEDLTRSLYHLLSNRFSIVPTRGWEELEASVCGPCEAELLGVAPGSPVLLIRRGTLDQHGRPFEYVELVYRGDNYVLSIELEPLDNPIRR